jgi:hypothetical protein
MTVDSSPRRRNTTVRRIATPVLVVLTVAVAGCGGGSDDSSESSTTVASATQAAPVTSVAAEPTTTAPESGLSHEELIDKLNDLCESVNADLADLDRESKKLSAARDYAGMADLIAKSSETTADALDELEDLDPSPEDEAAFRGYLTVIKEQQGLRERMVTAFRSEDDSAIQTIAALNESNSEARIKAAIALGADKCGKA